MYMSHHHQSRNHLDQLLRTLPQDDLPMTLCEFDGFAAGLLACPEDIGINVWLPEVWAKQGVGKFPDERTAMETAEAVLDYFDNIAFGLSQTGLVRPSYLESGQSDNEIWEPWIDGYVRAAALLPSVWQDFYEQADEDVQTLMSFIQTLHDIFTGRSRLSPSKVLEIDRMAPEAIPHCVTYIIKHSRPDRLLPKAVNLSKGPTNRIFPDRSGRPS
jgi:uncharacterized protein